MAVKGRKPVEVPEPLLRQLEHSLATGSECVIDLTDGEPANPKDIADLKRAIVRARYKHFQGKTIHTRFSKTEIRYWVTEKAGTT